MHPPRRDLAARVRPAASLLAWLYLSMVVTLCAWIVVCVTALGWQPVVMRDGSTTPAVQSGDVLMVSRPSGESVGAGTTVIVRSEDGSAVPRRIVSVETGGSYRLGATDTAGSEVVPAGRIVGVGRLVVPFIGLPVVWATAGGFPATIAWALFTAAAIALTLPHGRTRRRRSVR